MNPSARIRQPWLSAARAAWVLLAMYNLLPGLLGLPEYYRQLVAMVPTPTYGSWNVLKFQAAFENSGYDPRVVAWLVVIPAAIGIIITVSLGLLIFWRQSHEWLGLLASYCLVGLGGTLTGFHYQFLNALPLFWQTVAKEVAVLLWLGYFWFMILFPNGKFVPGWMRWVAAALTIWFVVTEAFYNVAGQYPAWLSITGFVILGFILVGKYQQYRWLSSAQEKRQIRWFLFAIAVLITFGIITNLYDSAFPVQAQPGSKELIIYVVKVYLHRLTEVFVSISIAIAIFRYRLWDIDLVIRRTLVYTALTALLGLVYFCNVVLLQQILGTITGQSTLAIVLSTLLIAALFEPLRRRLQAVVDRRFYRQKYDAALALEAFSSAARHEVELDSLTTSMVGVLDDTIQPDHVSIWLRQGRRQP